MQRNGLARLPSLLRAAPRPSAFPSVPRIVRPSSSSSGSSSASNDRRRRPYIYVLGLMPVLTFGLGCWQVQRLQWKLDLIDRLDRKLNSEAVGLPASIDLSAIPEYAYRKVVITGHYDHEHEMRLGPRVKDGKLGFHVITPLVRGKGKDTILVNRGFVTRQMHDVQDRKAKSGDEGFPTGEVQVTGLLRSQEPRNSFTPDNKPDEGQWIFPNLDEMAAWSGSKAVMVDEIFEGHAGEAGRKVINGLPLGREATIELRNQHLTYVVTWFSLSIATAFMFYRLTRRPAMDSVKSYRGVK